MPEVKRVRRRGKDKTGLNSLDYSAEEGKVEVSDERGFIKAIPRGLKRVGTGTALAVDPGTVPSTHTGASELSITLALGDLMPPPSPLRATTPRRHPCTDTMRIRVSFRKVVPSLNGASAGSGPFTALNLQCSNYVTRALCSHDNGEVIWSQSQIGLLWGLLGSPGQPLISTLPDIFHPVISPVVGVG